MADEMSSALAKVAFAKMAGIDPPKIDPRTGREDKRVRIRVRIRNTMQTLPGGHMVYAKPGTDESSPRDNFLIVYQSDLPAIEKLCEHATPAEMRQAEEELKRRTEQWLKAADGRQPEACPHSFPSAFAYVMQRELLPIEDLEVLGDEVAEPEPETQSGKASKSKAA